MRRRRLLLALAWLPCVLCTAAWHGSYRRGATLMARGYGITLEVGAAYLVGPRLTNGDTYAETFKAGYLLYELGTVNEPVNRWYPVRVMAVDAGGRRGPARVVVVSMWAPSLASALLATRLTRRPRSRPVTGLCVRCGYDLRATPDRCPECGTIPAR